MKQAKNPCLTGLSGIVIHETENAFKVINVKNQVKRELPVILLDTWSLTPRDPVIPKQGSIFTFKIPLYVIRPIIPAPPSPANIEEEGSASSSNAKAFNLDTVPQMEFELYGNQFRFRSADRAGRKFKSKETIEL